MIHLAWVLAANGLPTVKPNLNFPGADILGKILGVVFAIIVLGMVAIFFVALASAVNAFRQGNDSGVSRNVIGAILSAVVLGLVFIGTPFLSEWVNYLTG